MDQQLNVFGEKLEQCGCSPMTGWYRDGYCKTDLQDQGIHTVCCIVTTKFLDYSKKMGNDLSTPRPEFNFPGLKDGDHWCVCAGRWLEAYKEGAACSIIAKATHEESLAIIPLDIIKKFTV